MIDEIIKNAMERNPTQFKSVVESELMSRIKLALEAKKVAEEDDVSDEDDDAEEDE
jgi:hypothetical protein